MLLGMFQRAWAEAPAALSWLQFRVIAVLAVCGVVLGAWYMLWLVQRVFFGPLQRAEHGRTTRDRTVRDLSLRESRGPGAAGGVHLLDRPAAASSS